MIDTENLINELNVACFMSFGDTQKAKDLMDGLIYELDPVRYEKESIPFMLSEHSKSK